MHFGRREKKHTHSHSDQYLKWFKMHHWLYCNIVKLKHIYLYKVYYTQYETTAITSVQASVSEWDFCVKVFLFSPGEGIKVVASIHNKSSRDIKPKYCLYKKISYFAKKKRRVETKDILKEVGEAIPPSAGQTVTRTITIPSRECVSILNCNILKVEYRLRVCISLYKTHQNISLWPQDSTTDITSADSVSSTGLSGR